MNDCAVSIRHLRQGYGKHCVLDDVSLEIPRGQTFALLGRNGAGKTTLIRTLLGLLPPAGGNVEVLGLNPADEPLAVRGRVGYLAEDQAMYGWMTAADIARFLAPFTRPGMAAWPTICWIVSRSRRTRIKHLSKGQNVRLGLALALAHRPEIVILDDPALGLDPITRKQFNRDVIDHLQAEGRTVFYSSHLLYEVEAVADAVAILDQGRIVRVGRTELLQHDVKRVVLPREALAGRAQPPKLLDVKRDADTLAVTLDEALPWIDELRADGIEPRVEELSLDDIFEAYVIGKLDDWPGPSAALRSVMA